MPPCFGDYTNLHDHERGAVENDSDAYWVGAFAMALAMAHACLLSGRSDMAFNQIESVLDSFAQSDIWRNDPELVKTLESYWKPFHKRRELTK